MIFFGFLLVSLFAALLAQHFIPPLPWGWLEGSRVLLLPLVLFYAALAMPLWAMLILSFVAGFMWDALHTQIIDGQLEFSIGWSVVIYSALGALMSGFRPLFLRGRWEVHCLVGGVLTSVIVFAEYLLLAFQRGFSFPPAIWGRIAGAGLVAALMAPIIFVLLNAIARALNYVPKASTERDGYG